VGRVLCYCRFSVRICGLVIVRVVMICCLMTVVSCVSRFFFDPFLWTVQVLFILL